MVRRPKVYADTIDANSITEFNIVGDYGRNAKFIQLTNFDTSNGVDVMLNDDAEAIFTLAAGTSQSFHNTDLTIRKVSLSVDTGVDNSGFPNEFGSGAQNGLEAYVEVIVGI